MPAVLKVTVASIAHGERVSSFSISLSDHAEGFLSFQASAHAWAVSATVSTKARIRTSRLVEVMQNLRQNWNLS